MASSSWDVPQSSVLRYEVMIAVELVVDGDEGE